MRRGGIVSILPLNAQLKWHYTKGKDKWITSENLKRGGIVSIVVNMKILVNVGIF